VPVPPFVSRGVGGSSQLPSSPLANARQDRDESHAIRDCCPRFREVSAARTPKPDTLEPATAQGARRRTSRGSRMACDKRAIVITVSSDPFGSRLRMAWRKGEQNGSHPPSSPMSITSRGTIR
jgi:hypothetical protein